MAEIKEKEVAKTTKKDSADNRVPLLIPRLRGQNVDQTVYMSVNFKRYRIQRGKTVMVPQAVKTAWGLISDLQEESDAYVEENGIREP